MSRGLIFKKTQANYLNQFNSYIDEKNGEQLKLSSIWIRLKNNTMQYGLKIFKH